ncbi:hypothetical protein Bbelb_157850 [Branchiostoma belcheri]|nr:hypothetical protein Bbelb_157850 [Branchiostoma belcheri]
MSSGVQVIDADEIKNLRNNLLGRIRPAGLRGTRTTRHTAADVNGPSTSPGMDGRSPTPLRFIKPPVSRETGRPNYQCQSQLSLLINPAGELSPERSRARRDPHRRRALIVESTPPISHHYTAVKDHLLIREPAAHDSHGDAKSARSPVTVTD